MATSINDLVKFEPQIAGHDRLLRFSTNDLIVIKPCTESEHRFYEDAQKYPDFSNWLPECYGTLRAPTEHELKVLKQEGQVEAVTNLTSTLQEQRAFDSENKPLNEHLCIENVLYGFKRPCIMDVKIGYQLYEDNADPAKKEKMIKNAQGTTIETMGVRISGMKTYDPVNSTWTVYNKSYGRSRTKDDLIEAFLAYFFPTSKYAGAAESHCTTLKDKGQQEENDDNTVRKPIAPKKMRWILECLIDDVQAIRNFVAEHPALQLIGSSLLFVYEGDRKASDDTWEKMLDEDRRAKDDTNDPGEKEKEEDEEEENTRKLYDIRAIDFSHSKWDAKRTQQDPKLVKALDNLLHLLQSCLERQKQEKLNTTIS